MEEEPLPLSPQNFVRDHNFAQYLPNNGKTGSSKKRSDKEKAKDELHAARLVLERANQIKKTMPDDEIIEETIRRKWVECPFYGTHHFEVSLNPRQPEDGDAPVRLPKILPASTPFYLSMNRDGLTFVAKDLSEVYASFGFADIYKWGSSRSKFSLVLYIEEIDSTEQLLLLTENGPSIAGIILDYIEAIMDLQAGGDDDDDEEEDDSDGSGEEDEDED